MKRKKKKKTEDAKYLSDNEKCAKTSFSIVVMVTKENEYAYHGEEKTEKGFRSEMHLWDRCVMKKL